MKPHALRPSPDTPRSRSYAGIGSRKTPPSALSLISQIAEVLAEAGFTLRSGGAIGADTAFEAGCDRVAGQKEIFLPWEAFRDHPSPYFEPPRRPEEIAAQVHPKWKALPPRSRCFHARNVQQVAGLTVDDPVDFVLFWSPEFGGRVEGGTATAVNFARQLQIPTFNLWDASIRTLWERIIASEAKRSQLFWERFVRRPEGLPMPYWN